MLANIADLYNRVSLGIGRVFLAGALLEATVFGVIYGVESYKAGHLAFIKFTGP